MRISVVGAQFPDSLAHNLTHTLSEMHHDVQAVDEDKLVALAPLRHRFRRAHALLHMHPRLQVLQNRRIVQMLQEFRPELVISTVASWHPDSVAAAKRLLGSDAAIVFVYPDPAANLGREYPLAAPYDALFFKDPWAVELYRSRLGINAHYLPEACNPAWHYPIDLTEEDLRRYGCDVATGGNMYYYRAGMLRGLLDMDLRVWGDNYPSWLHSPINSCYPGVYVAGTEKAKAFRSAKIVVNTLSRNEVAGTNARAFEAAGCGAFQLVDWRPAIDDLFEVDHEIVVFRSNVELREKVIHYLERPEERERIALAGLKRAYAEHTYEHRINQMFRVIGAS